MHVCSYVCICDFITDLTLEQTDAKKVKDEDRIDGKTSNMDHRAWCIIIVIAVYIHMCTFYMDITVIILIMMNFK